MPPPSSRSPAHAALTRSGGASAREAEVWRSFREAGMLDDATFERKDREALLQRVAKLEGELYDYQYNMGLLLIEKQHWTSKYEDLQQGLIDAEEILKREQVAHLAAISEIERREENLKKALGIEKQCVIELEKALRELHAEYAEMKFTSDQKSADASSMMSAIEEKSLEAEAKQYAADAKLSELTRKSSDIEWKLQDLTARESMLQQQKASINIDKELHAKELSRQRDELLTWEKNLREGQERLVESQSLLNQRERRTNESDVLLSKKEKELDAIRDRIEKSVASLKEKEDYVNLRLTALADNEKELDRTKEYLERKEKELTALEEKLAAREKVELQKIMEEHKLVLDAKVREFEKDMGIKKNSLDDELQRRLNSVEKRERELHHREEVLTKKEQTLEMKILKLNDDTKDLDIQSKSLKTRDENLRIKELELEKKSKRLVDDEEELAISKAKLVIEWKSLKDEKAHILNEVKSLKVTEEEREQHNSMQSKLKDEIEEFRMLKELVIKEREDLRQDREKFEREWEALDEKRASLSSEAKHINEEKEKLEKWKSSEEERLANELLGARNNISRELAEFRLRKEAFEGKIELERAEIHEKLQQEREDLARELENKKHELQMEMQKKLEDSEHKLKSEVAEFNKMRESELFRINSLRESALLDVRKMKAECDMMEREKQEYIHQRKKIEEAQLEIRNDIASLCSLSKNLKNQREDFVREREHFLSIVDKYKTCQNCGVTITELLIPSFLSQHEIEDPEKDLLPSLATGFLEDGFNSEMVDASRGGDVTHSGALGGRLSWLRSCTKKIFSFSPGKKDEETSIRRSDGSGFLDWQLNRVESTEVSEDLFDNQRARSNDRVGVLEALEKNGDEHAPCFSAGVEQNSLDIGGVALENGDTGDIEKEHVIPPVGIQNEGANLSSIPKLTSAAEPQKKRKGHAKGKQLKRTRSVQRVVEESKFILGKDENSKIKTPHQHDDGHVDASLTDQTVSVSGHKRRSGHTSGSIGFDQDANNSDGQSESISLGRRRKRNQVAAPSTYTGVDKHYNLRRSTVAGSQSKRPKNKAHSQSPIGDASISSLNETRGTTASEQISAQMGAEGDDKGGDDANAIKVVQRVVTESIAEVSEFSLEMVNEIVEEDVSGAEAINTSVAIEDDGYVTEDIENVSSGEDSGGERHNASISKKLWKFFTT